MSDHVHQYAEDVQREAYNERAIVLAWLGRPEVAERVARWLCERFGYVWSMSPAELADLMEEPTEKLEGEAHQRRICDQDAACLLAALRQLAEEGK